MDLPNLTEAWARWVANLGSDPSKSLQIMNLTPTSHKYQSMPSAHIGSFTTENSETREALAAAILLLSSVNSVSLWCFTHLTKSEIYNLQIYVGYTGHAL